MTKREAAILSAYTGIMIGEFSNMHKYVEEIMGRPIWVHEFPSLQNEIKKKAESDLMKICKEIKG